MACDCCGAGQTPPIPDISQKLVIAGLLWLAIFWAWPDFIAWVLYELMPLSQEATWVQMIHSTLYCSGVYLLLLCAMTFVVCWLQVSIHLSTIRNRLNSTSNTFVQIAYTTVYGALMPRDAIETQVLFLGLGRIKKPKAAATAYLAANLLFNKWIVAAVWTIAGMEIALGYVTVAAIASIVSGSLCNTTGLSLMIQAVMTLPAEETQTVEETRPCIHERYTQSVEQTRSTLKKWSHWIVFGCVVFAVFLQGSIVGHVTVVAWTYFTARYWLKKDPLTLQKVMNQRSTQRFYLYVITVLTTAGLLVMSVS